MFLIKKYLIYDLGLAEIAVAIGHAPKVSQGEQSIKIRLEKKVSMEGDNVEEVTASFTSPGLLASTTISPLTSP